MIWRRRPRRDSVQDQVATRVRELMARPRAGAVVGAGDGRTDRADAANADADAANADADAANADADAANADAANADAEGGAKGGAEGPVGGRHRPEPAVGQALRRAGGRARVSAPLARLPQVRAAPGRRVVAAVAAVVVLVTAVGAGKVVGAQPRSTPLISASPASRPAPAPAAEQAAEQRRTPSTGASGTAASASPVGTVVVDVAGKVVSPGIYRLPLGARVADALSAAGGPVVGADLTGLNRARPLVDGEQVAVGIAGAEAARGPAVPAAAAPAAGSGAAPARVDLNRADLTALQALPGVGPVTAARILDWRAAHGRFNSVEQLRQVAGIGPVKFAALRPAVTV